MKPTKPDNPTFSSKGPFQLNACVGKNGLNDITTYEDGFHDAVMIMLKQLIDKRNHRVDTLVYPIIFSARHRIELFLKWLISEIEELNNMKKRRFEQLSRLNTHDLKLLWDYAEELCLVDQRYNEPINTLKGYIQDYFDVDLTGETFRYPFNNSNQQHLEDRSLINMLTFGNRYVEMSDTIDHITEMTRFIEEEYRVKTFVGDLSRNQLEEISNKLPDYSTWGSSEFDYAFKELMDTYLVSKRKLSIAINVIKSHREFSRNIGKPIIVQEIDRGTYQKIKSIKTSLFSVYETSEFDLEDIDSLFNLSEIEFSTGDNPEKDDFDERFDQLKSQVYSLLSVNECAALLAFHEIGRMNLYSEFYDHLLIDYLKNGNTQEEFINVLARRKSIESIEEGMISSGQDHLL